MRQFRRKNNYTWKNLSTFILKFRYENSNRKNYLSDFSEKERYHPITLPFKSVLQSLQGKINYQDSGNMPESSLQRTQVPPPGYPQMTIVSSLTASGWASGGVALFLEVHAHNETLSSAKEAVCGSFRAFRLN